MTLHETNDAIAAVTPVTPTASAAVPEPQPAKSPPWNIIIGTIAGIVVAVAVGAGIGYVAADDADEVDALRRDTESLEDDVDTLEDDLDGALADLDSARADAAALETAVSDCIEAATSFDAVLTAVDDMSAAYDRLLATAVGSPEQTTAAIALDDTAHDVFRAARSTGGDARDCADVPAS